VGLLATGGSTNHALHLPAIARAAGIVIDWRDLDELSAAVPLLARIYPNGSGDVNDFHHAGGMAFTTKTLLEAGLLHADILTAGADDFAPYATSPRLEGEELVWEEIAETRNPGMLRPTTDPFLPDGGMRLVGGNLGRAIFKTSAVTPDRWVIEAPCRIFSDQNDALAAFQAGELNCDVVVAVRFQGPRANGMPELHKLTPMLGVLQDKGFKVALVTDGRMSGASGKVPAAIHCSPEALNDGPLAKPRDGDIVRLDGPNSLLEGVGVDLDQREAATPPPPPLGTGRELFAFMRATADNAEHGASAMLHAMEPIL
jgi:phosphogluconate dehydratase